MALSTILSLCLEIVHMVLKDRTSSVAINDSNDANANSNDNDDNDMK